MKRDEEEKENSQGAAFLFFPLIVLTIIPIFIGWVAARFFLSYRVVKSIIFPTGFIISNVLMFMPLMIIVFIAAIRGKGNGAATMAFDLVMWESVFLPVILGFWNIFFGTGVPTSQWVLSPGGTPAFLIIGYQVFIWWFIGRHVNAHLATAVYDAATVKLARRRGISEFDARIERAQGDSGYAREAIRFENRQSYPFISPITVAIAGGDFNEMYGA